MLPARSRSRGGGGAAASENVRSELDPCGRRPMKSRPAPPTSKLVVRKMGAARGGGHRTAAVHRHGNEDTQALDNDSRHKDVSANSAMTFLKYVNSFSSCAWLHPSNPARPVDPSRHHPHSLPLPRGSSANGKQLCPFLRFASGRFPFHAAQCPRPAGPGGRRVRGGDERSARQRPRPGFGEHRSYRFGCVETRSIA